MSASCLYLGAVAHQRHTPRRHGFRYRVWMLYLDLAEVDTAFAGRRLWSTRRPSLVWFRRADHVGPPEVPLDEAVRDVVEQRAGVRPRGPIRLLTHPRWCGAGFNPISVYYCFSPGGERLEWAVAEVTNTPWGELQLYVLDVAGAATLPNGDRRGRFAKMLHVSPFLPMDMEYTWTLDEPGERLSLWFACSHAGERVLDAGVDLVREEITPRTLRRTLLRRPPMPLVVLGGIYWNGLRLWRRGVPVHPHPARPACPQIGGDAGLARPDDAPAADTAPSGTARPDAGAQSGPGDDARTDPDAVVAAAR